jgi:hypothetical protein
VVEFGDEFLKGGENEIPKKIKRSKSGRERPFRRGSRPNSPLPPSLVLSSS